MGESVQVTAIVAEFEPNAMQDHMDDGSFDSFDAAHVRVVLPADAEGTMLTIFVADEPPADSLWRAVDRRVTFEIDAELLAPGATIFDGAISELRPAAAGP
jgi:hypothetical protein